MQPTASSNVVRQMTLSVRQCPRIASEISHRRYVYKKLSQTALRYLDAFLWIEAYKSWPNVIAVLFISFLLLFFDDLMMFSAQRCAIVLKVLRILGLCTFWQN